MENFIWSLSSFGLAGWILIVINIFQTVPQTINQISQNNNRVNHQSGGFASLLNINKTPSPSSTNSPSPTLKPIFSPTPTPTFMPSPSPTPTNSPTVPPSTSTINKKVFLLIFNPIIESQNNQRLISVTGWSNPDSLSQQYINDIYQSSHQIVQYAISQREEIDNFPVKSDGFQYSDESYLNCWYDHSKCHDPDGVDYQKLISDYQVCDKLNAGQIDELWIFGGPWFGFWEAVMAGPGAFNTNGPPITGTSCQKKLHIMGFNYERGVAEMIENVGHRAEGTLNYVYGGWDRYGNTPWDKYTWIDKYHTSQSGCGSVHYSPNSDSDYDWSNQKTVTSNCEDWLNYPNLSGATQSFNCSRWNCDGYQYKKWWLSHLPHVDGSTDGKLNNWWKYIVDTNNVF